MQLYLRSRIGFYGENITAHHLISRTIFLPMWGLQNIAVSLWDSLMQSRSIESQLCEDNVSVYDIVYNIEGCVLRAATEQLFEGS